MENFLRTAPKTEIKRVLQAALELEKRRGTLPERRSVLMPSFCGGKEEYRPVTDILYEEQLMLRSR